MFYSTEEDIRQKEIHPYVCSNALLKTIINSNLCQLLHHKSKHTDSRKQFVPNLISHDKLHKADHKLQAEFQRVYTLQIGHPAFSGETFPHRERLQSIIIQTINCC